MQKLFFFALLIGSLCHAQYTIKGTMYFPDKYNSVYLYSLEGVRKGYINNAKILKETKFGTTVGAFSFTLPTNSASGFYRIYFDLRRNKYVDFIFNKENIALSFSAKDAQGTVAFATSKENKLYQEYLDKIIEVQNKLDSLQIAYLEKPSKAIADSYKATLKKNNQIQAQYQETSTGTLANFFISANRRYYPKEVIKDSQQYLETQVAHFFDFIDFSDKRLYHSNMFVESIANYVFYTNQSNDTATQTKLYKKAVNTVFTKITDISVKSDVIQFLTTQFISLKDTPLIEYLMQSYFYKLPLEKQDPEFKKYVQDNLAVAEGRQAPDFSWQENGATVKLSELSDGKNYLLIFYSTSCSHCLREVPQVYDFLKNKTNTKVVAFALETDDNAWKNYIQKLGGWHHVLGLKKWDNKIARTYQVNATPTYFVLDSNKKIIAKPDKIDGLKTILNTLN